MGASSLSTESLLTAQRSPPHTHHHHPRKGGRGGTVTQSGVTRHTARRRPVRSEEAPITQ
eukprot:4562046-Alexandrium_andersonii.AAC.1